MLASALSPRQAASSGVPCSTTSFFTFLHFFSFYLYWNSDLFFLQNNVLFSPFIHPAPPPPLSFASINLPPRQAALAEFWGALLDYRVDPPPDLIRLQLTLLLAMGHEYQVSASGGG